MIPRQLEPEVMDTPEEAIDYDTMDHGEVNRKFVDDLLANGFSGGEVLDVGTGTALIPIQLCSQFDRCRIMAIDLAVHMLDVARLNVARSGLQDRIQLAKVDAKNMPYSDGMFDATISNSIVHHIEHPEAVVREAVRVTKPGGLLFVRDLCRPRSLGELELLVDQYAGNESAHAQSMFAASLHAALTLDEIQQLLSGLGIPPESATMTSDRHWTWCWSKS